MQQTDGKATRELYGGGFRNRAHSLRFAKCVSCCFCPATGYVSNPWVSTDVQLSPFCMPVTLLTQLYHPAAARGGGGAVLSFPPAASLRSSVNGACSGRAKQLQ